MPLSDVESSLPAPIAAGTIAFRRTSVAMIAGGLSTFAMMYCVQPVLPIFVTEFGVSPAASSLTVSLTTGMAALMFVPMGVLSDRVGRKPLLVLSLFGTGLATVAAAVTSGFAELLLVRLLTGIAIAGIPAILTTYAGEEIEPEALGYTVGLTVAGNALGGMTGRVVCGFLTEWFGWRPAFLMIGSVGLACGVLFWHLLPKSRRFRPSHAGVGDVLAAARTHLGDAALHWLFPLGALLMGALVVTYNYLGFRLTTAPFNLSPGIASSLFSAYLAGIVVSGPAGRLADRFGRRKMVWIYLLVGLAGVPALLSDRLWIVVAGLLAMTASFFSAHACASSWVVRRAPVARGQASSAYMFSSYMGGSLLGALGGIVYHAFGWGGVVGLEATIYLAAVGVALRLAFVRPLAT